MDAFQTPGYNKAQSLVLAIITSVTLAACSSNSSDAQQRLSNNDPNNGGSQLDTATPNPRSFSEPTDSQIRPGVLVSAAGSQCTSNFIYHDRSGNFYIGAAAHCFSPDTNSGIDACETRNEPLGTEVVIENANFTGSLVYSSWQAMQAEGETPGSGVCASNDFALIRIDSRDANNVHPAALVFGGPTALFVGDAANGDGVHSYGQSPFHLGIATLERKDGNIASQSADGWLYSVTTDNPGLSGDSGSAVLHESGRALGVLSSVGTCIGACPLISNGVVNLEMALAYANSSTLSRPVSLTTWADFNP